MRSQRNIFYKLTGYSPALVLSCPHTLLYSRTLLPSYSPAPVLSYPRTLLPSYSPTVMYSFTRVSRPHTIRDKKPLQGIGTVDEFDVKLSELGTSTATTAPVTTKNLTRIERKSPACVNKSYLPDSSDGESVDRSRRSVATVMIVNGVGGTDGWLTGSVESQCSGNSNTVQRRNVTVIS